MAAARHLATAPLVSGWAVLAIGAARLALPQRDVRQVDLAADLKISAAGESPETGWLLHDDGPSWPAYSLDERLALDRAPRAGRRVCVFIGRGGAVRGLLCERVASLAADADLAPEPLPGCMTGPHSPATGIARFEDTVALVTDAAALGAYLDAITEAGDGRAR